MRGACGCAVELEVILLLVEVVVASDHEVAVIRVVCPVEAVRGLAVGVVVCRGAAVRGSLTLGVDVNALAVDIVDPVLGLLLSLGRSGLLSLSILLRLRLSVLLNGSLCLICLLLCSSLLKGSLCILGACSGCCSRIVFFLKRK